ncbi:DUF2332 domain-containing protein [Spirillospora sp. NPDC127200]
MTDPLDVLRHQARYCADTGAAMYAELLARAADDYRAGGPVARLLAGRGESALALRLLGTVHRLVLEGRAPELAAHYPTAGGTADPLAAWPAFRAVLAGHEDEVRAGLADPPQTNEVGRAAALVGGLLTVAAETGLPVRLLELGASAGLNLRADRFRYNDAYGPADSPVTLPEAWRGGTPPVDAGLRIVERLGCDPAPLDPADPAARLRLLSYVWPDQPDRARRLRAALELAARVPATVVRQGAGDFTDGLEPREGVVTVVWHSVMWMYLPAEERARVSASLEAAGAAATAAAPFAHLAFEVKGTGLLYPLTLRLWPGGGRARVLGESPAHGVPVTWF